MHGKFFLISTSLLIVASCSTSSGISDMREEVKERLELSVPDVLGTDAESIGLDAGLGPALRGAVMSHERYLGALAIEREALAQVGVADSVRGLQLIGNVNVGGIREQQSGKNDTTTTGAAGGMSLSKLVYDGGASASATNRSTAIALSAQAERISQGNDIALNAAQSWINLWQYGERLRLMHIRTSEMGTLVDQIERMASSGMLDRASVDSALRQIVDVKLEESQLLARQSEAQVFFKRFFHTVPLSLPRPAEIVGAPLARSLAANWSMAPSLQRQAAELLAAQAALGEAQAAFRPRALLQAGARTPMENNESTDMTVGFSLEYSFNDGGRRQNQLNAAKARVEASDAQLRDLQLGLEAELEAALTRLDSIERSIPLLVEKLRLSRSEAKTSRSQLMTGQSNLRFLVEAEIEIYRAQDRQVTMRAEQHILLLKIASLTGELGRLVGLPGQGR